MAWAYLVGGEGDGQLFERPDEAITVHPRWGKMLPGPGRWTYQATGQRVRGAQQRCEVHQAHGRWVVTPHQPTPLDEQVVDRFSQDFPCPACAAKARVAAQAEAEGF